MRKLSPILILLFFSVLYFLPGLGQLEFFRHTEADRTLIGWGMLESGEFLVPHLLGRVILTKPPLFYWLIAASIHFTGEASEFAARLPSVLAATFALLTQFLILCRLGFSRAQALIGTLLFATGMQFFVQSTLAEIDMCFAWLSSSAMFLAFLGILEINFFWTLLSYLFLALAFLTKGPPAIFFYLGIIPLCVLFHWRDDFQARRNWKTTVGHHLLGLLLFAVLVGIWLNALAARVGWGVLAHEFHVEVVNRVVAESSRGRGPLFYLWILLINVAPWSLFALLALYRSFGTSGPELRARLRLVPGATFFVFNLIGLLVGTLMLSIAAGKSSRYFFPLYPLAANVCIWLAACVTQLFTPAATRRALLSLAVFALASRALYISAYVPFRNESRSVKPLVTQIEGELAADETLYVDGMWERWIAYYLKRDGRNVRALTPDLADSLPPRIKLLLSPKDEPDRLHQVSGKPSLRPVKHYDLLSDDLVLLEIDSKDLSLK